MYIPHIPNTLTLTRRAESAPTSVHNEGFWEVQANFWGTIAALFLTIAILTGLLVWCLVCWGKRKQKKLAREKEREKMEKERAVGRVIGKGAPARSGSKLGLGMNGSVRKSDISRPFAGKGGIQMERLGEAYDEKSWGARTGSGTGSGSESPVPSYHSKDVEVESWTSLDLRGASSESSNGNGNSMTSLATPREKDTWHRVEVDGTVYMNRKSSYSARRKEG